MTVFRVGQRVRVRQVTHAVNRSYVGREGIVTQVDQFGRVTFYGLNICALGCGPKGYGFQGYQLEPILDQRHEACDEDFKRDLDRMLEGVSA